MFSHFCVCNFHNNIGFPKSVLRCIVYRKMTIIVLQAKHMSLKHKETDSMTIIMIIMDTGDSEVDSNAGDSIIVQSRMKYLNRLIIVLKKLELN